MDGGNQVYVGSSGLGGAINASGAYAVNDIDLTLTVTWMGGTEVRVDLIIKNNQFFNTGPETPAMPAGPPIGVTDGEVELTMSSTDADDHNLWYQVDFTNMVYSEWMGPFASGETASVMATWDTKGTEYPYRVRVKDEYDDQTGWSPYNYIDIVSRGDANGDGSVNVGDAVYLITFIFKSGPAPDPMERGDANCDGSVNIGDGVRIINFIFGGGSISDCSE